MKKTLILTGIILTLSFFSCSKTSFIQNDETACKRLQGQWIFETKSELEIASQSQEPVAPGQDTEATAIMITTTSLTLNPDEQLLNNKYSLSILQSLESITPLKENRTISDIDIKNMIEQKVMITGTFFANANYLQLVGEQVSKNDEEPQTFEIALNQDKAIGQKITNLFWYIDGDKLILSDTNNPENKISYLKK